MPDTLSVAVNREGLHSLSVPNAFEVRGSFDVEINNHGTPLHVHLHLDDALSSVATLEANNHYVEEEATRLVRVAVDEPREVRGKLKVVTAHGATTRYVDVTVREPEETEETVTVDESLSTPSSDPDTESGGSATPTRSSGSSAATRSDPGATDSGPASVLVERPELLVLGLGAVALAVAAYAVVALQSTVVALGALAVLAGVLVAVYLLV